MLERPKNLSDKDWLKVLKDVQNLETRHRPPSSVPENIQMYDLTFALCFSGLDFQLWPSAAHKLDCKKEAERVIFRCSLKHPPFTISAEMLKFHVPKSESSIYEYLYPHSRYDSSWRMRVIEFSVGSLANGSGFSERSVKYALSFFRKHWYIRRIWRGRPDSRNPRYHHSCYELPLNLKHVQSWRIHKGRKRKK